MDAPSKPPSPHDLITRARTTFDAGRTRSFAWREAQLDALEGLILHETDTIEDALAADLGRSRTEGFLSEVFGVRQEVQNLRRGMRRWSAEERSRVPLVLQPASSWIRREPLGVVLVIGPWNYPINLILSPLAAALAAGNTVIAKPSEHAPASSALLARLLPRYLDEEAVLVAQGGAEVTTALIDERVDHIFFTGSATTGRLVMKRAAEHLTPVTLELGGKSPAIVDTDADIDVAARRIAWGKFMNAGQSCIAPDYVLVHATREQDLLQALSREITALYGVNPRRSSDYGRIVNDSHLSRLTRLMDAHEGQMLLGGEVERDDRYFAPTIILDPSPVAPLMQEEIFGPILPVVVVEDLDTAISFVSTRPSPLAIYVFTADSQRAQRVIDATRSGAVAINTTMHQFLSPHIPFGGIGESGIGTYHGRFGFDRLTQLRPVFQKPTRPDMSFAYPPFGRLRSRVLRRALSARWPFRMSTQRRDAPKRAGATPE